MKNVRSLPQELDSLEQWFVRCANIVFTFMPLGMAQLVQLILHEKCFPSAEEIPEDETVLRAILDNGIAEGIALSSSGGHGWSNVSSLNLTSYLLVRSWDLACLENGAPTQQQFVNCCLRTLAPLRRALRGEEASVPAVVSLIGFSFPSSVEAIEGGGIILRNTGVIAQALDPLNTTKRFLGGLIPEDTLCSPLDGRRIVLAQFPVPFAVRVGSVTEGDWCPQLFYEVEAFIQAMIERIRLALILTLGPQVPRIVAMWRAVLDPLFEGGSYLRDPRSMSGWPASVELDHDQCKETERWLEILGTLDTEQIRIAKRRLVQAVMERDQPDDALIDAVVVWESLLGAKLETSLRVCTSLAILLSPTVEQRRQRFTCYKKLYAERSGIVHGSKSVENSELRQKADEATAVCIDLVRTVLTSRRDLLDFKKSEDRSLHLILEG